MSDITYEGKCNSTEIATECKVKLLWGAWAYGEKSREFFSSSGCCCMNS